MKWMVTWTLTTTPRCIKCSLITVEWFLLDTTDLPLRQKDDLHSMAESMWTLAVVEATKVAVGIKGTGGTEDATVWSRRSSRIT